MKRSLLSALLLCCAVAGNAQVSILAGAPEKLIKTNEDVRPVPIQATFMGFSNPPSLDLDWQPVLASVISENESDVNELVEEIKKEKAKYKTQTLQPPAAAKSTAGEPIVSTNYAGPNSGGNNTPLDHTVAVSNGGKIVAMINSRISYYNQTSGTPLYTQTLAALVNDNTISSNMCDPKVIYSPSDDRFIIFAQTCDAVASTSKIILGFSKTNDPASGWYFYNYTGNPLSDNSWFDYPKIGISADEVFVAGNLFYQGSNNFNKAVVYQIQKTPCFSGLATNAQYWTNFPGGPFTLLPISWGQGGSNLAGIYMVSTLASGGNGFNIYAITNNIASTTAQLQSGGINSTAYSPAADAPQPGGGLDLNVGDCRVQDGFYLNGFIHFVHNTDAGGGWNGLNYNRLDVANGTNISSIYGEPGVSDNCFPAVASISNSATDKSVVIVYNRVSSTVFPEMRVIKCDNSMTWSNSVLVKAGQAKVNHNTGSPTERWGDYSGIGRKFNDNPASVWVAAGFGTSQQYWGTWLAKISAVPLSVPNTAPADASAKVYPNPIQDDYNVEFSVPEQQQVTITIADVEGRLVKELHKGTAAKGRNTFSFNKANLAAGTYFLAIRAGQNIIKNEKIVVTE